MPQLPGSLDQEQKFRAVLACADMLYAHKLTWVARQTAMPAKCQGTYESSGLCTFEGASSSLIQGSVKICLDMGYDKFLRASFQGYAMGALL